MSRMVLNKYVTSICLRKHELPRPLEVTKKLMTPDGKTSVHVI